MAEQGIDRLLFGQLSWMKDESLVRAASSCPPTVS
jgi:hypothetical protein